MIRLPRKYSHLGALFRTTVRRAPATTVLCALILIIYVITAIQSWSLRDNLSSSPLAERWLLFLPEMHSFSDLFRSLGAVFLHIGPAHLMLNVALLFIVGSTVERYVGSRLFLMFFIVGGLGSSLAVMVSNPLAYMAGASGSLSTLMVIFLADSIKRRTNLTPALVLLGLNIVITILFADGPTTWSHFGGMFSGAIMGWALMKLKRKNMWWVLIGLGAAETLGISISGFSVVHSMGNLL